MFGELNNFLYDVSLLYFLYRKEFLFMSEVLLSVQDEFGTYRIGYEDAIKYHGRRYIAGVAVGFQCLSLAFAELSKDKAVDRSKVRFFSGMKGLGVKDAVEMVTRCVSRGRYVVDTEVVEGDSAPGTPGEGRFYFEVSYGTRMVRLRLKHGLVPDEFAPLCLKDEAKSIAPEELKRLQEIKENVAAYVIGHDPREIFDYEVL
jgi:formylmethanofuran dehydrogenase subunit E